jgi:hydroxyisourate hydrolase
MKILFTLLLLFCASFLYAQKSQLSTQITELESGKPIAYVQVGLLKLGKNNIWIPIAEETTDENGKINAFLPLKEKNANVGNYRLVFYMPEYYKDNSIECFFSGIQVEFTVKDDGEYFVPLRVSPTAYSTQKGN